MFLSLSKILHCYSKPTINLSTHCWNTITIYPLNALLFVSFMQVCDIRNTQVFCFDSYCSPGLFCFAIPSLLFPAPAWSNLLSKLCSLLKHKMKDCLRSAKFIPIVLPLPSFWILYQALSKYIPCSRYWEAALHLQSKRLTYYCLSMWTYLSSLHIHIQFPFMLITHFQNLFTDFKSKSIILNLMQ